MEPVLKYLFGPTPPSRDVRSVRPNYGSLTSAPLDECDGSSNAANYWVFVSPCPYWTNANAFRRHLLSNRKVPGSSNEYGDLTGGERIIRASEGGNGALLFLVVGGAGGWDALQQPIHLMMQMKIPPKLAMADVIVVMELAKASEF